MKRMIVVFVFLITLLSSCKLEEDVIKVGFAATLTGEYSPVGTSELYGAQLAVKEINETGGIDGKQIELIIKNDEADPSKAVAVDNELMNEGVRFIIGHALTLVASEVLDNAKDKDVLFLSPSIGTDSLTGLDDNFIRNVSTTYNEGEFMTNKIIETEPTSVLLIYNLDNYDLTKYHKESFEEVLNKPENSDITYSTIGYHTDNEEEITSIEEDILLNQYDAVMICAPSSDASIFVNYIITNDLPITIHLSSWASTGLLPQIDTVDLSNIFAYSNYNEPENDYVFDKYKEEYITIYDQEPNMLSANAYDLVYVLKAAIEYADSTNVSDVKEAIIQIESFNGIASDFTINAFGDVDRQLFQMIIVDGKYVLKP
jgi:branched-chain amino acid transport system substrate-binding protein